jgi:hypothetical protein
MAKRSSKNQVKKTTTANFDNAAPTTEKIAAPTTPNEIIETQTTTSANTPPEIAAVHHKFREFIETADSETIQSSSAQPFQSPKVKTSTYYGTGLLRKDTTPDAESCSAHSTRS